MDENSKRGPITSLSQMPRELLGKWENKIFNRVISPRHFEVAAFRVCQVLYEGKYSGILKPMVYYIPLEKDFLNFDEVIRLPRDEQFCEQITENCYRDPIASGEYSYRKFIQGFDRELLIAGFEPQARKEESRALSFVLLFNPIIRIPIQLVNILMYGRYPGRNTLVRIARPIVVRYCGIRGSLGLRRKSKATA